MVFLRRFPTLYRFNKTAADVIKKISESERISAALLAVTWMNESSFETHPAPNDNGHPEDINKWDVGPFQLNIYWTLKAVEKNEVSFAGLNEENVFGYNFYRSDGTTPAAFSGDAVSNGRMAARRLKAIGGTDLNKAMKYTKPSSQPARKASYNNFAGSFQGFFNCYRPLYWDGHLRL